MTGGGEIAGGLISERKIETKILQSVREFRGGRLFDKHF